MGDLVTFPAHRARGARLSKAQIADHLGRSTRWVELQMRDHGMPYERTRSGEARFTLPSVMDWLEERAS